MSGQDDHLSQGSPDLPRLFGKRLTRRRNRILIIVVNGDCGPSARCPPATLDAADGKNWFKEPSVAVLRRVASHNFATACLVASSKGDIAQDRHNPDLRRKAYTAIAAKMARTVHAVIKSGEPFEATNSDGKTFLSKGRGGA